MKRLHDLLPLLNHARVVPANAAVPYAELEVLRVHTDTRSVQPGDLFVALQGDRFDAHNFLSQAQQAGAVAAIAQHGLQAAGLCGVEVPDSKAALGELAQRWRAQFNIPVMAVTGSNGKTTVTHMVASMLRAAAGPDALSTQGNFNNDIGVPLSVLRLRAHHTLAVFELGMNHPGEIAHLAAIAQPCVVVVTNAQREHQEFMHTVEAVATENASAFAHISTHGVAVFPANDPYTPVWRELARQHDCRVMTFGETPPSNTPTTSPEVHGHATWSDAGWALVLHTPHGSRTVQLRIAGRHNVRNALAAAACALAAGVSLDAIAHGLDTFEPVTGRSRAMTLHQYAHPITLVDDTYNANPDSVRAAIDVLAELPGPRLLVLGDMGEVGEQGAAFHDEVLRYALAQGVERIWVMGDWMAQTTAALRRSPETQALPADRLRHFDNAHDCQQAVIEQMPHCRSVLIKGSRFMRMERLVQALEQHNQPNGATQGVRHAA